MIFNAMDGLMTSAEKSVTLTFGQRDAIDSLAVRAYVGGYVMGFVGEQIAVAAAGAGVVSKAGRCSRACWPPAALAGLSWPDLRHPALQEHDAVFCRAIRHLERRGAPDSQNE